jgi:hypothetical protein
MEEWVLAEEVVDGYRPENENNGNLGKFSFGGGWGGGGTMVSFLQYGANTKNVIPQMGSSYQNNLKNN